MKFMNPPMIPGKGKVLKGLEIFRNWSTDLLESKRSRGESADSEQVPVLLLDRLEQEALKEKTSLSFSK